jgi:ABC-type transport system involved in multi-copper enzyme maturation permease subunit
MFYFLLSLMFSAASNSRGAAIGIPMAVLFSYQFVVGIAPWTLQVTPWGLTNTGSSSGLANSVATALAQGQAASVLPIIATLAWCLLFVVIAVWRFNRDEF